MKKFKLNWFVYFIVLAFITFTFVSCPQPQNPSKDNPKELTLNYNGGSRKYYYLAGGWYSDSACKNKIEDTALQPPENKRAMVVVKFNGGIIQDTGANYFVNGNNPFEWDFVKYVKTDDTAKTDFFKGDLKLPENGINENVDLTAVYDETSVMRKLPMLSKEGDYTFKGYMLGSEVINGGTDITVTPGMNVTYSARFDGLFKLTVKDGESVKDTVYYNTTDNKWYKEQSATSEEKTSVAIPQNKTYTITLDYDNNGLNEPRSEEVTSSFLGYGVDGTTSAVIRTDGSLSVYTINEDTELVSLWSEVKFTEPSEQPTKDGYTFSGWYNGENSYSFDSVVTGDMTLTAHWTKKTFNTLTLNITGSDAQTLYYGSDNAWYKALNGDLLLDVNKVEGEDVKFNIPSAPTWTVTFNKNTPAGAIDSDFTITSDSVDVVPELSLSDDSYVNKITGKVLASSISENVTVTGTYPPKAIGQSVTAESTNRNYEFAGWTVNGVTISDIDTYAVSGNITIKATWNNISNFKMLTVKDGEEEVDAVYYNTKDGKWYGSNDITSELKTSVKIPEPTQKTYIATLNYDNGSSNDSEPVTSSFNGYEDGREVKVQANGLLSGYTINSDTILFAKWSDAKFNKPSDPTKDGYTFNGWYNGESPYNFNDVVTGNMTLTAHWTQKTFNTLTLNITDSDAQTLYYGSDSAWYKALGNDDLLLNANKVTGEDVKFIIPSAPVWTVTFDKNIPKGTSESDFTITSDSVDVVPELSLSDDSYVNKITGKVLPSSISEDKTVTGTYPSTAIVQSVTASSTNANYEFAGWTVNNVTITNIADYEVNGDTTVKATWKNLSSFKTLTVKDGESVKDTVYYNTKDSKWYVSNDITSGERTTVNLPEVQDRTYTITLAYDNGSSNGSGSVTSSFLGYGTDGNTSPAIGTNGSLSGYTIDKDTELVSIWSKEKYSEPSQPTRDGYVFNGWYNGDDEYSFDSVVKGDITLTAHWTQKTYKTLTLNITNSDAQTLYYGSDNAWYKALSEGDLLLDVNKVTADDVRFNIPSAPTWTVTFDKNPISGMNDSEITITPDSVDVTPELSLSDDSYVNTITGKVIVSSIRENVTIIGTYPPTAIGQRITASSDNPNYEFAGWTANGKDITDIFTYEVSGKTEIVANWNNISNFKMLTVKDGESKDTAYYNVTDKKWYVSNDITSELKTSVTLPTVQEKTYRIILDYENGSSNGSGSVTSSFLGYGIGSPAIGSNGSLSGYTISDATELVSLWSEAKFNAPSEQPTKDGYMFSGWYNGESSYSFDSVVTGNMTLTARWTQKTYNTLTLAIGGQQQKLYYGSDDAWYTAVSENDLLLDANKVTGEDVKFNIPSAPVWTVTFDKNTPDEASTDDFVVTPSTVPVTPDLTLNTSGIVDTTTGKVLVKSITEDTTVTGSYLAKAIGESVTAESTNRNYEFEKWTANGEEITDIANHQVNGNTEIVANWKNVSDFKVLTVKTGDKREDTAYYNIADGKWYAGSDITSELKTSVNLPEVQEKTYTITLNYDNNTPNGSESVTSSFLGYGIGSPAIGSNGSLSGYTISDATELVSLWSEAKFNEPSDKPTKDGYNFDAWYKDGTPYDFNSVVTGDKTLTAHWTKKTYKTLKLDITDSDAQTLYYGSDGAWYKALSGDLLLDVNKVEGEDVKFNIPSAPVWTVTFDKNVPNGASESEFTITLDSVDVTPDLTLTPANTVDASSGKVLAASINSSTIVVGTYPPKAIGQSVRASSTNANYVFAGWTANGFTISNIATWRDSGNTTIKATWKNISSFKTLTVKDGESVKDTAYYNARDHKWYVNKDITSGERTTVNLPEVQEKTYTITLNYNNGSSNGSGSVTSSFLGYGIAGNTSPAIGTNGSLSGYTINNDTELVSLWSEAKFNEPSQPTKDGYVFNGWYNGENSYDFNSVVTGDMTLTAHWKEKPKKLTVKDGVNEKDTAWYNSEDNKWYANENMTDEKTSVAIPQNKTYTITLDYDNNGLNETRSEEVISSFRGYGIGSEVKVSTSGSLSVYTINEDTELVSLWSEAKFNAPSEQPTKDGYMFSGWYNGESSYSFDSVVTGNMTLTARWTQKTYNTLTLAIGGQQQKLYYGSDDAWYKALNGDLLLDVNKVEGEDVKFNIPSAPVWTVTFDKNISDAPDDIASEFTLSHESLEVTATVNIDRTDIVEENGNVLVPSIEENITVNVSCSQVIGQDVTFTNVSDLCRFNGWLDENGDLIPDIANYVVSKNETLRAQWAYKVTLVEYYSFDELLTTGIIDYEAVEVIENRYFTAGENINVCIYYEGWFGAWIKSITGEFYGDYEVPERIEDSDGIQCHYEITMPAEPIRIEFGGKYGR